MVDVNCWGTPLDLPTVERRRNEGGSWIEPAMGADWSEDAKLAWHTAVIALDSGVRMKLCRFEGGYNLVVYGAAGPSSVGGLSYFAAWDFLNGIRVGAAAKTCGS